MRGRTMNTRKRILWSAGALVLVAAPAVIGLWGNASFAESVPLRVPPSGQISTPSPSPTSPSTPSPSPSPSSSFDDDGGDVPRDQRLEPGDDRDVQGGVPTPSPSPSPSSDDHGGHGGDDRGGDDHGGDGGDDHGGDDHGGHGGDD